MMSNHIDFIEKSQKQIVYWKNTVDNLTSLQFYNTVSAAHEAVVRIYQVPKRANLDNYDLVDEITFSAETDLKSFTGLDGDLDKEYLLHFDLDFFDTSNRMWVYLNNDTGANYTRQSLFNQGGSILAANTTGLGRIQPLFPKMERSRLIRPDCVFFLFRMVVPTSPIELPACSATQ